MEAVPLTWATWLAALLPILVLLVLLVGLKWPTSAAAPVALAAAVAVAVALFATPLPTLAVASGKALWDALFILYVVWPALLLYQVANEAGAFGAIQHGVRRLLPDRLLVVLALSWVLASFIQSIAGFGTPLAVTTPLLVGLGMKPVYAVLLPLLGTAWGNVYGSLGVPWFATQAVVDLDDPSGAAVTAALFLWIPNLLAGLAIAWIYGRGWALRRGLPAIVVVSLLHGGIQLALVTALPSLANLAATGAALVAVLLLARWRLYRRLDEDEPTRIFLPHARTTTQILRARQAAQRAERDVGEEGPMVPQPEPRVEPPPSMSLGLAFAPYAVLAGLALVALVPPPVRALLERVRLGLPFPETTTGYAVVREAAAEYGAFMPLTHPGTLLLASAAAAFALYRSKGLYPRGVGVGRIARGAAAAALPATTSVAALLLVSKVMDHAGQVGVLALGIAAVLPPLAFVAASNLIGVLGTLLTSSSTASNILFAPLQETTAAALGVEAELVVAAQVTGAATGGAIGPGDLLLGATVAGVPERVGEVLARALPWVLVTGALVSAAAAATHVLG